MSGVRLNQRHLVWIRAAVLTLLLPFFLNLCPFSCSPALAGAGKTAPTTEQTGQETTPVPEPASEDPSPIQDRKAPPSSPTPTLTLMNFLWLCQALRLRPDLRSQRSKQMNQAWIWIQLESFPLPTRTAPPTRTATSTRGIVIPLTEQAS